MAHIDLAGDEAQIKVCHNPIIDKIVIRIGYDGTLTLRDKDEAHNLVDQLQAAITEQTKHQGRELLRDEERVRAAAETREAL
jgi:hypothetical protein